MASAGFNEALSSLKPCNKCRQHVYLLKKSYDFLSLPPLGKKITDDILLEGITDLYKDALKR